MIHYYSEDEIEKIRASAQLVSKTLGLIASKIEPGVSTLELDKLAEEFIRDHGAKPAFKGYQGFPNTLCMSRNEEVVHGIPSKNILHHHPLFTINRVTQE